MSSKQIPNNPAVSEQQLLPTDKNEAVKIMINITENLINFSEREGQALAQNDLMSIAIMQDEKTIITERYVALSTEFRNRLEQYRGADAALLDRLEALQKSLGENTRHNNKIFNQIQNRAQKKTEAVLMTSQQLGQSCPVKFAGDTLLMLNEQQ